ncbi:unnamed protein product [Polarella glacialis]|uniref:Uncharacterized protein n=1 Tax=Polarella glacialis TaxID=89957 RepID=A0A813JCB1_POLGL|nr:unnamed protein product [Polarella glacialis]CAE8670593.1 unnamed protein product [Polarella glacialis]
MGHPTSRGDGFSWREDFQGEEEEEVADVAADRPFRGKRGGKKEQRRQRAEAARELLAEGTAALCERSASRSRSPPRWRETSHHRGVPEWREPFQRRERQHFEHPRDSTAAVGGYRRQPPEEGSVVSGRFARAAGKEDDGVDIVYAANPLDETISEADADIRLALFAWEPEADAQVIQLKVSPGARFLLSWSQPEGEGGFWAYGYVLGAREQLGYVPLHILAQRVEEATPAAVPSSGKAHIAAAVGGYRQRSTSRVRREVDRSPIAEVERSPERPRHSAAAIGVSRRRSASWREVARSFAFEAEPSEPRIPLTPAAVKVVPRRQSPPGRIWFESQSSSRLINQSSLAASAPERPLVSAASAPRPASSDQRREDQRPAAVVVLPRELTLVQLLSVAANAAQAAAKVAYVAAKAAGKAAARAVQEEAAVEAASVAFEFASD